MLRLLALPIFLFATAVNAEQWDIAPGPDAEEMLQEALILAQPGDEVVMAAGRYPIRNQISIANDDITLRGAGMAATVLSFQGQTGGSEGILITGNGAILKDFAVEDTSGDGIKSKGVDGIAMIRLRVEWTNGPDAANGAYGLYPVQSKNVLIDGALVIGASDAGIYVGQSENIIVRDSRGEFNVAGLEIENSYFADVHDNVLTNNTGGILVFDLPDLPQQGGHHIRVFRNRSFANNTPNFAPEGNIVGIVPAGTGMLVMANADVEVFENTFADNRTVNFVFASYVEATEDAAYLPHPARIHIHHNTFGISGTDPDDSEFGNIIRKIVGVPVPNILWDGVMPLGRYLGFGLEPENAHSIHDNDDSGQESYANADFMGYFGLPLLHSVRRNVGEHDADLSPLSGAIVTIRGRDVSDPAVWAE
jgi:parallel beta-helix repeat protein